MIWIITLGWMIWGVIMYKLGWRTGVGDGTLVTLQELKKQKIIAVDPKTDAIYPGSAPRQRIADVVEKIRND